MKKYAVRQSFTVPAVLDTYAPEVITLAQGSESGPSADQLLSVTVMIEQAVANAKVELWLLKIGGSPGTLGDYFYAGQYTQTGQHWLLASWSGAQVRVKGGGIAGTEIVNATADE